jgi:purine-binding chemotaxis protein CheW
LVRGIGLRTLDRLAEMVARWAQDSAEGRTSSMAKQAPTEKKKTSQFVGFQLADQAYAFQIEQIQEIVILDKVTRTPQVPDYCEGVSNLRGSIIPIINLRKLFGLEPRPADGDTRTIVVNVGERTMGCTVDMVSQVVRISDEDIQPAPETVTADGADYISGFARLKGDLVILLDIDELLDPDQLDRIKPVPAGLQEPSA